MKKNILAGKRVAVLGVGVSGEAVAQYALRHAKSVLISDAGTSPAIARIMKRLRASGARIEMGKHTVSAIARCDVVIVSPGIPPRAGIIQKLKARRVRLMSEIELAARMCVGRIIMVTGTNGKSTVTTLIAHMLTASGYDAIACGNLGTPFISCLADAPDRFYVVEVSSFQLYYSKRLSPEVAVLLNITPDHLDWHRTMNDYVRAKLKPFRGQSAQGSAVFHTSCRAHVLKVGSLKAKAQSFSAKRMKVQNDNHAAVCAVARVLGVEQSQARGICAKFPGLEHRVERVASRRGLLFVNDSKATTPDSIVWALNRCSSPVVLIAGGKNKGLSFRPIRTAVKKYVRHVVLIGESACDIAAELSGSVPITQAGSLRDAVRIARTEARRGDTVLLSPGCASFDMFKNYKDRGKQFKELVRNV